MVRAPVRVSDGCAGEEATGAVYSHVKQVGSIREAEAPDTIYIGAGGAATWAGPAGMWPTGVGIELP